MKTIVEKVYENLKNNEINHSMKILEDYISTSKARNKNSITKAFNYKNDDEW
ncbi:Uncharacterised protein, partial [Mesomycoplasma hyorhinis]